MTDAAERAREDMWRASERSYHERRRLDLRESWAMYHEAQAQRINRLMRSLIEEHRSKARALLSSVAEPGEGVSPPSATDRNGGPSVIAELGEDKQVSEAIGGAR
jgi:hypothetical protein